MNKVLESDEASGLAPLFKINASHSAFWFYLPSVLCVFKPPQKIFCRGAGATTQQVSKRLQSELMTLMMSGDKVRAETVQILSLWVNSSILSDGNALKYLRYSVSRAYPPSLMAIIFCLGSVSAAF